MYSVQLVFHVLNLCLFLGCCVAYGHLIYKIMCIDSGARPNRRATDVIKSVKVFKYLALQVSLVALFLSLVFIGLQIDWIIQNYNKAVGDAVSWAWLIWGYLLVMYMITSASIGHVLLSWRGGLPTEIVNYDHIGKHRPRFIIRAWSITTQGRKL